MRLQKIRKNKDARLTTGTLTAKLKLIALSLGDAQGYCNEENSYYLQNGRTIERGSKIVVSR